MSIRFWVTALSCCTVLSHASAQSQDAPASSTFDQMVLRSTAAAGESRPSQPVLAAPEPVPAAPPTNKPAGFALGVFTVLPSVTAGGYYDSNVFALPRDLRVGDWASVLRPEFALRLDGSPHSFTLTGFLDRRDYLSYDSENQTNGAIVAAGTVKIDDDTQFQGKFQYLRGHEDRGAGESVLLLTDKPATYDQYDAAVAVNKRWNRWFGSVGAGGLHVDYSATNLSGVPVDESYRNGVIGVANARLGYVVAPLTGVFVDTSVNARDFNASGYRSNGYRIVGGALFEPGPGSRVKGEAYIGYMRQEYSGSSFPTISTYTYGGALAFLIQPELIATIEAKREAKESALAGGVSLIESLIGARLDYQIIRNLTISGGANYVTNEFERVNRTDSYWSPSAGLKYMINPFFTVGFDYRHLAYEAGDTFTRGFRRDVYLASANARF